MFKPERTIRELVTAFLTDRRARNSSMGTLEFYSEKLAYFLAYCQTARIEDIETLSPDNIRKFLIHLEECKHNSGGVHAIFRAVRTLFNWYEFEFEPVGWKNPFKKIKAPKLPEEPLDPVSLEDISKMLATCEKSKFVGARDYAAILCLLDSGARANEFLKFDRADIDLVTGETIIRQGKGRKPRTVYLGVKARKALRKFLSFKDRFKDNSLWVTHSGFRLSYNGLREILVKRSKLANVPMPELHSFRRACALNLLKNGADIYTIQKVLGHSDLQVIKRYIKLANLDIRTVLQKASPVDNFF